MHEKVLIVDMDNSILKTDLFYEMLFKFLKSNLFNIFKLIYLLVRTNKLYLKNYLANLYPLDISKIPINESVYSWIKNNKKKYTKVILCSGSPFSLVRKIANQIKIIDDCYGSTEKINLIGINKVEFLREKGIINFDYIGDSIRDIPLWKNCDKKIIVNCGLFKSFIYKLIFGINFDQKINYSILKYIKSLLKLFRINQWVKNFLLLIHFIVLGKVLDFSYSLVIFFGFLFFSIVSSFGYVINDLVDLEYDRGHASKKYRPFASGDISPTHAHYILLVLISLALLDSVFLISDYLSFILFSILYVFLSINYSFFLKKIKYLDCYALSFFFAYRIFAGSLLDLDNNISIYLLCYSILIFYSLATMKRYIEIKNSTFLELIGRPYSQKDLKLTLIQGLSAVLLSVIFLIIFSESIIIFNNIDLNLFLSVTVFYLWIFYLWYQAILSKNDFDLVVYSYSNILSRCLIIIFLGLFFVHNYMNL